MKRIAAITLLATYLFTLSTTAVPYLYYMFNFSYIVRTKCVNRDRPWMHCNGKCYLMKLLEWREADAEPTAGKLVPPSRVEDSNHLPAGSAVGVPASYLQEFAPTSGAGAMLRSSDPPFHPPRV